MIVLIGVIIFGLACLANWDGKCHCDLDKCESCPYNGACEWQKGGRK